jgi:hypothetical protein
VKRLSPALSAPLKILGEASLPLPHVTYGEYYCDYCTVIGMALVYGEEAQQFCVDSTVDS